MVTYETMCVPAVCVCVAKRSISRGAPRLPYSRFPWEKPLNELLLM